MSYRIDDLARLSQTNIRNIRAYQEKGLLPQPRREGRFGVYDDAHLARLRVISALLDRGYSLGNIGDLLQSWETGSDLREILGLEQALTSPFVDEVETTITVDELDQLFGSLDAAAIARAAELELLIPTEDGMFRVPSMRLLRAGAELNEAGIPLPALMEEHLQLRAAIDHIAERLVDLARRHIFDQYSEALPEKTGELVRRSRPIAQMVVEAELSRALERHTRTVLGDKLVALLEQKNARAK